ncbi:lipopolysaccharide biosynthesis protein [Stenoxybacter acetivorans]|uniref:lipopolysaccharide biosynthesis protein n=1 Tax=Stenoxybacter acetivorans TaxID=422441 RepID=UPI00068A6269|nr:hypothetical protein [Stenoxybacter acetivorans]
MPAVRTLVIKNISANLLLQIINTVGSFILPPLIIVYYGSEINGMIASAKQFISYLTLLEAGVGAAGIVALYQPLARGDIALRNRILASVRRLYRFSGSLFIPALILLACVYAWITRHELSPQLTLIMVLLLGFINVLDFFLFGTYRVLLAADQKQYVLSAVQAVSVVGNVAASYVLIKWGYSIVAVQCVASAVLLLKIGLTAFYVRHTYSDLHFHWHKKNAYHIEQTWDVLFHQLCALVIFSSPLVLITLFLTLKDASVYAVYALVFMGVKLFLQTASQGMQAIFGHTLHGELAKTQQHFLRYEIIFFCALGWIYSATAILFMPFITLYTANMTDADYHQPTLALMFLLAGFIENCRIPAVTLIMAAGHYRQTKPQALLETGINLIASVILIRHYGLAGLLGGAVLSFLLRGAEMVYYSHRRIIHLSQWRTYVLIIGTAVLATALTAAGIFALREQTINNYAAWLQTATAVSLVCAVLFGVWYRLWTVFRKNTQ